MTRTHFRLLSGLAACAAVLALAGCSGTSEPDLGQQSFTSTTVQNHTHTVTMMRAEIESPPAEGVSRATTTSSGHFHIFTLTAAELQSVNAGVPVTAATSVSVDHSHNFTISKWF